MTKSELPIAVHFWCILIYIRFKEKRFLLCIQILKTWPFLCNLYYRGQQLTSNPMPMYLVFYTIVRKVVVNSL